MNRVQAVGSAKFGIVAIEMTGTYHQPQVERLVVLSLRACHAPAPVDVDSAGCGGFQSFALSWDHHLHAERRRLLCECSSSARILRVVMEFHRFDTNELRMTQITWRGEAANPKSESRNPKKLWPKRCAQKAQRGPSGRNQIALCHM